MQTQKAASRQTYCLNTLLWWRGHESLRCSDLFLLARGLYGVLFLHVNIYEKELEI